MTATYLCEDSREKDYFLSEHRTDGELVDLSDDFLARYQEAVNLYDGVQAELELIYKSKVV